MKNDFNLRRAMISFIMLIIVASMYFGTDKELPLKFSDAAFWQIFVSGILVGNIISSFITYSREKKQKNNIIKE